VVQALSIVLNLINVEIDHLDQTLVLVNIQQYMFMLLTYDEFDIKSLINVQSMFFKSKNKNKPVLKNILSWLEQIIKYVDSS
jgi:hypothetical protein